MKRLLEFLENIGIDNSQEKCETMIKYMEGILEWNEHVNLTAIKDRDEFISKHFIDSLLCCTSYEYESGDKIMDLGTGGGFPGVPLAICFPEKEFVLLDSLAKRIKIVNELCEKLQIKNVNAIHGRAEEIARKKEMRESFDICLSRAVANMSTLSEYCIPFVKKGGYFIAYKGPDYKSEIDDSQKALDLLGGKLIRVDKPENSPGEFEHRIVYVLKEKNTPKAYPRKAGTPSKKPL